MSPKATRKSPAGKSKRPAAFRRGGTKAPPARKPAARRKATRQKPAADRQSIKIPNPLAGVSLSLDRKIDIAGILMALLGFLTILVLFSSNRSSLTGGWVWLLHQSFGWGTYILSVGLLLVGLWLILRNFERIPWPSPERVIGSVLLYFNSLIWLHMVTRPESHAASMETAAAGQGGGYLGGRLLEFLLATLDWWGAIVVLLSWLVIALILVLDRTVIELFAWAAPIGARLRHLRDRLWSRLVTRRAAEPMLEHMTPLARDGLSDKAALAGQVTPGGAAPNPDFAVSAHQPHAWILPPLAEMLDVGIDAADSKELDEHRGRVIEETLASFGAPAHVVETNRGPTITQFGVEPDFIESRSGRTRVRVGKIAALADDLALALAARRIRIQAPVPGKGYVGIEVPNEQPNLVTLRDVLESEAFKRLKSPLRFALGQDVAGNAIAADLAAMPHLLIAGATGSGKSVCVNAIITGMLVNNTPDDLRMVMVDPKRVELTGYNGIPHLLAPVVVELERVVGALQWIAREMDQRYHKFSQAGARNIADYNARLVARGEKKLPYVVVIIDELADLMMIAPDETERNITRLAQLARATGIHLVIATQRPSVDVVTGLIKANFPARVAFAVASGVDSRVILDQPGAERLLGSGDMLFQAPDAPAPVRLQGVYVSDNEIQRVVQHWRSFLGTESASATVTGGVIDGPPAGIPLKQIPLWDGFDASSDRDPLLYEAIDLVRRQGRASVSMLQRRLRIGYTRAARIIEGMEAMGIVGPPEGGAGARNVLDYGESAPPAGEDA
jgi:DNA segregation ATPase FtsK/SpoIIIE, S-DNA-T family